MITYQPGKYIPTMEVANRWGVSQKTIQRLIKAGVLKAAKFGTRNLSVLSDDVLKHEQVSELKVSRSI